MRWEDGTDPVGNTASANGRWAAATGSRAAAGGGRPVPLASRPVAPRVLLLHSSRRARPRPPGRRRSAGRGGRLGGGPATCGRARGRAGGVLRVGRRPRRPEAPPPGGAALSQAGRSARRGARRVLRARARALRAPAPRAPPSAGRRAHADPCPPPPQAALAAAPGPAEAGMLEKFDLEEEGERPPGTRPRRRAAGRARGRPAARPGGRGTPPCAPSPGAGGGRLRRPWCLSGGESPPVGEASPANRQRPRGPVLLSFPMKARCHAGVIVMPACA